MDRRVLRARNDRCSMWAGLGLVRVEHICSSDDDDGRCGSIDDRTER